MNNINNKDIELVANLTTLLSKESIELIYISNNIKYDRTNLYGDFIQSLISIIFDTYLGDELTNKEERLNHFKWCWNKNLSNFKEEDIIFEDNKDLCEYFMVFLFEVFYMVKKEQNNILTQNISKMWLNLFDINKPKTKSDVESFLEVYELFEISLLNGKTY